MKCRLLKEEFVKVLVNYLGSKPYIESAQFIEVLRQAQSVEVEEKKEDEVKEPKSEDSSEAKAS